MWKDISLPLMFNLNIIVNDSANACVNNELLYHLTYHHASLYERLYIFTSIHTMAQKNIRKNGVTMSSIQKYQVYQLNAFKNNLKKYYVHTTIT